MNAESWAPTKVMFEYLREHSWAKPLQRGSPRIVREEKSESKIGRAFMCNVKAMSDSSTPKTFMVTTEDEMIVRLRCEWKGIETKQTTAEITT